MRTFCPWNFSKNGIFFPFITIQNLQYWWAIMSGIPNMIMANASLELSLHTEKSCFLAATRKSRLHDESFNNNVRLQPKLSRLSAILTMVGDGQREACGCSDSFAHTTVSHSQSNTTTTLSLLLFSWLSLLSWRGWEVSLSLTTSALYKEEAMVIVGRDARKGTRYNVHHFYGFVCRKVRLKKYKTSLVYTFCSLHRVVDL